MNNSEIQKGTFHISKINQNFSIESKTLNRSENLSRFYLVSKEIPFSNINDIINKNDLQDENEENDEKFPNLYFIKSSGNNEKSNKKERDLKFIVIKQNESSEFLNKKKRRGRIKRIRNNLEKKREILHDKNKADNLLRTVQVHYLSFIVKYLNDILKNLKYNQKFLDLDYNFKKNIKKEFVEELKTKTIGEIISNKVSIKYKKKDKFINKKLYESIKKDEILKNIFEENYIMLFRKIYFKNKNKINLNEFGINKEITFSPEIKTFQDLFKNKQQKEIDDKYIYSINKCVRHNFLSDVYFESK